MPPTVADLNKNCYLCALIINPKQEMARKNKTSKKEIKSLTKEYEKWQSMRAPREGIVIRKDDDPIAEAFKLKTAAHYNREAKQHDDGEVDIEETA